MNTSDLKQLLLAPVSVPGLAPRLTSRIILVASLALLSACGGSSVVSDDSFYRLVVPQNIQSQGKPLLPGTIVVKRFSADSVIGQRPVAFIKAGEPQTVYQYHYHFWTDAPTRLLQDYAVEYLRRGAVAERVVTPEMGLEADYQLLGRIRRLEFVQGSEPAVAASLQLSVIDNSGPDMIVLETYSHVLPVKSADWVSASAAMNTLLARLFKHFSEDLATK